MRIPAMPRCIRRVLMLVTAAVMCAGCASPSPIAEAVRGDGPGDLRLAYAAVAEPVRNLPKSRIGNRPFYTVFGHRYSVLDSAEGFKERGVASWYGAKFHGRDTSSGEPYDMHAMTAAHKHLPLPTFVRVTRTDTGQSVVVKVNDRGPFVEDRIIDLSYGAAARLDMLDNGTAPVEIEALSTHHVQPGDVRMASVSPVAPAVVTVPSAAPATAPTTAPVLATALATARTVAASSEADPPSNWIQIGAFRDSKKASGELHRVAEHLGVPGRIERHPGDDLFRVRLGPLAASSVESTVQALASAGVASYTMVTGAPSATVR